jgi:hypothetical protein
MRLQALILALVAAACLAAAAEQSPLANFVSASFEPDDAVQTTPLLADGNYYLVSVAGEEVYVVDASSGTAVLDPILLKDILLEDTRNRGGYEDKVASAISFHAGARTAKKLAEGQCVQYIGDDGDPGCTDKESCLVSCFSVPQCEIIVQSDGFLEAAMDWNAKRKEYESLLDAYSTGIEAIRFDSRAIDSKIAILSSLSSLAANMSQNGIFLEKEVAGCIGPNATRRCYEYCPRIDYSEALIASQSQSLSSLKSLLSQASQQQDRASALLARSAENDAYVASRGRDYEDFRVRMQNDLRNLQSQSGELNKTVSDPQVGTMISQLGNVSEKAKNYSGAGYYRKALALRPVFEALSNATFSRIASDNAAYSGLESSMAALSSRVQSSIWLIGSESAAVYYARIAALGEGYPAPLTISQLGEANASLAGIGDELSAEIAEKAVQAGNSTSPQLPSGQQSGVPDFAWLGALALAGALIYAFMLRSARRAPPLPPPPAPPQ